VSGFRERFLEARRRLTEGEDPEAVVPELLSAAEAQEEIDLAEGLYSDGDDEAD
jgi:hypothetical protein